MVWKGSDRRIGKVRLVIEKRFGKIAAMIFSFFFFCADGPTNNKNLASGQHRISHFSLFLLPLPFDF